MPADKRPATPNSAESSLKDATPVAIPILSARERLDALKQLGRYKIERKLGQGGMGTVFLAKDTELKRLAAIKILPEDKAQNPILVKRFRAEAQAAAQLRHDNIVTVFDSGETDGLLYIAMEYVDGPDVFDLIQKRGRIAPRRSLEIIRQTALALQHAFEKNIVHRDIKPSNLMVRRDGVVKLTDLGLARSIDETLETNITRAGTTVGTVDYMSPEQARNSKLADIRSDIYSLGCTWYHMLTGSAPYAEGAVTNKLHAHATQAIPDPRDINPEVPEGFVAVLQRMMAKKPADRHQTPAELLKDLDSPSLKRVSAADQIAREVARERESDDAFEATGEASSVTSSGRQRTTNSGPQTRVPETHIPETRETNSRGSDTRGNSSKVNESGRQQTLPPRRLAANQEDDSAISFDFRKLLIPLVVVVGIGGVVWFGKSMSGLGNVFGLGGVQPGAARSDSPFQTGGPSSPTIVEGAQPVEGAAGGTATGETASAQNGTAQATTGIANTSPEMNPAPAINPQPNTVPGATTQVAVPTLAGLPRWALEPFSRNGLPVITVSMTAKGPQTARTLTEAIKQITPAGAVIRLSSKERHDLPVGLIIKTERLLIEGDEGFATIQFVPNPSNTKNAPAGQTGEKSTGDRSGLMLQSQQVAFEKIHWVAEADEKAPLSAMVRVESPRLTVRNTSWTSLPGGAASAEGSTAGSNSPGQPLTAIDWRSTSTGLGFERGGQLLMESSMTRGNRLTALAITGGAWQAVVRQSALVANAAPLMLVESALQSTAGKGAPGALEVARALMLQHVTAVTSQAVLDIAPTSAGSPSASLWVGIADSLLASNPKAKDSAMIRAAGWPQNPNRKIDESRLVDFTIVCERTLTRGLTRLYDTGDAGGLQVNDAGTWRRFFATDFGGVARPDPWPLAATDDAAAVSGLDRWTPVLLDGSSIADAPQPQDNSILGCDVALLSIPALSERSWSKALAPVQALRLQLDQAPSKEVVPLDLATYGNDLGQLLSRSDLPQNGHFEISGFGIRPMTPVVLKNRRLILTFVFPSDKAPLILQPKPAGDKSALFEVEGGSLEIRHATIRGVGSSRPAPEAYFSAKGGTIICREVEIQGGVTDDWQPRDVFHIQGSGKGELGVGFIQSTALTPGRFASIQGVQSSLLMQQAGVVSGVAGIHIEPGTSSGTDWHQVDAQQSTLLAGEGVLRLFGKPDDFRFPPVTRSTDGGTSSPPAGKVRLFFDRCILGNVNGFGRPGQPSALIEIPQLAELVKRTEWHSQQTALGPAPDLLVRTWTRTVPVDPTAWQQLWQGTENSELLFAPGMVAFEKPLPPQPREWKDSGPELFQLSAAAKAVKSGEGGQPLGVIPRLLDDIGPLKKGKSVSATPEKGTTKTGPGF